MIPASKPETLIAVYAKGRSPGVCRGCRAAIYWYTTVKNKRPIPINHDAVPRRSEPERRRRAFLDVPETRAL